MRGVKEGMDIIAGESPSAGQLAEYLSDPADADVAYKEIWNVRVHSCGLHGLLPSPTEKRVRG
jgi:hypothetical protein